MTVELIVSALPGEIRAARLDDGRLSDLLILRAGPAGAAVAPQAGDLFLAKVKRYEKGLDGAFVDLGLARDGLLPKKEAPQGLPSEGGSIAVKVVRAPSDDPGNEKGARVSARNLVLAPEQLEGVTAPARLAAGSSALADFAMQRAVDRVVADDAGLLRQLKAVIGEESCSFALPSTPGDLFEAEGLEGELEALLIPRVELARGGFLLIEPGRTLTAIDVNAGRHEARGGQAAQARAVNLAAVPEIARQLRLRALCGLIVVDFLALKAPEDRKAVASALKQAVAGDPEPCQVFGISPSGLLEMTRRRGRAPLHELLCRSCGLAGSGREKTPETLAYEALRHVAAEARGKVVQDLTLRVGPATAAALRGAQAAALQTVEQRLGRAIAVEADPLVAGYTLVLG